MKRTTKLLVAVVALIALGTGVAIAASSPTVTTNSAVSIGTTTALLRGTINPNGNQTAYTFSYGPTTAYGLVTASRSAGHGVRPVLVGAEVTNLQPGTLYHFRVQALNSAGSTAGRDRTFTTKGHPPALAVTGPAVNVGTTTATVTGSVNPQGEATTWFVQYGLTPYSVQTIAGPQLPAVNANLPVSVPLSGLAPGKLFHYRLVAVHAGQAPSTASDATFFTFPARRRAPQMHTRTRPGRATHKPFQFTTAGSVSGALFVPQSLRCTGVVAIRYFHGSRQVAFALAQLEPNCTFSTPVPFKHLVAGGPAQLSVKIHYRGNGYLKPVSRTDHVTLG